MPHSHSAQLSVIDTEDSRHKLSSLYEDRRKVVKDSVTKPIGHLHNYCLG